MTKFQTFGRWMIAAGLLLVPASAEDAGSPWEVTGAGALSAADGNSESVAYSLQLLATYAKGDHQASLGADYFYAENNGAESSDSIKLHEQLSRTLDDRWFISQYGAALKDKVAEIDYRVDTSALLGYRLFSHDRGKLVIEAGPGYAWEKQEGSKDEFVSLRFAQRFEYLLSENTKVWQSLGWTPRADDWSDSLIEVDAGIETRIRSNVALRAFIRHRVDASPARASDDEDTALMFGLSYDLGGVTQPSRSSRGGRRSLRPMSAASQAKSKPDGWHRTAVLGLSANRGNSDKQGMQFELDTDYTSDAYDLAWELDYQYAEDNEVTSKDRLSSRGQYNHYLDGPAYLGGALSYLRDDLADIAYRLSPSVLAGYALVKTDATRFALEAGPVMTFEETGGQSDEYASLMIAERFKHRFNESYAIKQSVAVTGAFDDAENYTAVASVAFDTQLGEQWVWRIGVEYYYDNMPAKGRDHLDMLMTSSVGIAF